MEHGAQQGMRRGWLRVMVTVHRLIMQLVKAHQRKKPRAKKSTKNKARSKNKKKKKKRENQNVAAKKKSERRWKTRKFRQRQTEGAVGYGKFGVAKNEGTTCCVRVRSQLWPFGKCLDELC